VPRSTYIGLDGGFAPWVGELLVDVNKPILLIVEEGREVEAITRLSRVGFDNIIGILDGGVESWKEAGKEIDNIETVTADELSKLIDANSDIKVFDVRKPSEYQSEHVAIAKHAPLSQIGEHYGDLPENGPFYLHCGSGYRSVIANSMMKASGIHNGIEVVGGWNAIVGTEIETTEFVCPTTL
jgi:hydroxyacylglutathione hydrolase